MVIVSVLIERGARALDNAFTYLYEGKIELLPYVRVRVPFHGKNLIGFVEKIEKVDENREDIEKRFGFSLIVLNEKSIVDESPILDEKLITLARKISSYYMASFITVLQAMLPPSLSPRSSSLKKPKIAYERIVEPLSLEEEGLTPKQIELMRLLQHGPIAAKRVPSVSALKGCIDKKRCRISLIEVERKKKFEGELEPSYPLLPFQQKAYEDILASDKNVILLQGVTGSGKTEVYLHLSEYFLERGGNVLMLVPEINLTPRMVEYFEHRFGDKVAVLHSELSDGERYDAYRRIRRGDAPIVIGARSAVFAPLPSISLIILDEEHVDSYKQENAPHYHAREVAIWRAEEENAKLVLGSATPSLESKARALKGVYGYTEMKERVSGKPLPSATIIDMKLPSSRLKDSKKISRPLAIKIKEKLEKKEQCLLLLNRRGYWVGVECATCGHLWICPNCGASLTFHKEDSLLKCHHCGHVELYPSFCPDCHQKNFRRVGYGTERLDEEIKRLFPEAKVARLDSDVASSKKRMEEVLKDFREHKLDILVGTQMIAKGHDFPDVGLSALVDADIGLMIPGYRSAERVFNLVCQMIGRAGRAKIEGEALVQTFNPRFSAIRLGAMQDYETFFREEMRVRKEGGNPPYRFLILLSYLSKHLEKAEEAIIFTKEELEKEQIPFTRYLGPIESFYKEVDGKYRKSLLISGKDMSYLKKRLKEIADSFIKLGITYDIDVDPLDC